MSVTPIYSSTWPVERQDETLVNLDECADLRAMDVQYGTDERSPLHHDNRWCPIHGRGR